MTFPSSVSRTTAKAGFLRQVLLADATTCFAMAALHTLMGGPVASLTGMPAGLVLGSGLALIPIAGFIAWTATRLPIAVGAVRIVILGNIGWAMASLALAADAGLSGNGLGRLYICGQALGVLLFALVEYMALRQACSLSTGEEARR